MQKITHDISNRISFTEAEMYNRGYFKGWYFKCCTEDKTIAFIPAYHCSNHKKTASLQIITDDFAFNIPFDVLE